MKSPRWNGFYPLKIVKSSSSDTPKSPSLTCSISTNSSTIKIVKLKSKEGSIILVLSSFQNTSSTKKKESSWCCANPWEQEKLYNRIFLWELQQRSLKIYQNNPSNNTPKNNGAVFITQKPTQKSTYSKFPNSPANKPVSSFEFINKTYKFPAIESSVCKPHFQK